MEGRTEKQKLEEGEERKRELKEIRRGRRQWKRVGDGQQDEDRQRVKREGKAWYEEQGAEATEESNAKREK